MKKTILIIFLSMLFSAVNSQNVPNVVLSIDLKRYAGTWYEIARLPNSFERNLKCITATYTLREDGKITVLNQGQNINNPGKKSSAKAVAWIPDKNVPAKLKVQFFWPFRGDYWILDLDKDYRYALVGDPTMKYLWILCREKKMEESTYNMLLKKATDNGYDVKPIIRVAHDCQ
ncbi:MAG: lipocalin family protein [Bacteroidales bacterium]|jgi:lipocalin|nr:lipocalin family protein [Bacteroidales bacterium]